MTTLSPRSEIVKTKRIINSELIKMQKACFDEETLHFYKEDNEEHLYWEQFDFIDHEIFNYTNFSKKISLNNTDLNTFTNKLTEFKVVGEVKVWQGHTNEQVKAMKDVLEKLKRQDVNSLND